MESVNIGCMLLVSFVYVVGCIAHKSITNRRAAKAQDIAQHSVTVEVD